MKKIIIAISAILLITALLLPLTVFAADDGTGVDPDAKKATAAKIDTPVTVDGTKDDAYSSAPVAQTQSTPYAGSNTAVARNAKVQALYDADNLYFFCDITSGTVNANDYFQLNLGELLMSAAGQYLTYNGNFAAGATYESANYTIKFEVKNALAAADKTESGTWDTTTTWLDGHSILGVPVDVQYVIKIKPDSTGYVVEFRYGFDHLGEKTGAQVTHNLGGTATWVEHAKPATDVVGTQLSYNFFAVMFDNTALYAYSLTVNAANNRNDFYLFGRLSLGQTTPPVTDPPAPPVTDAPTPPVTDAPTGDGEEDAPAKEVQTPGKTLLSGKITTPVSIDCIKDDAWAMARSVTTKTLPYAGAKTGASATVYSLWDDNNLYLYCEVTDTEVIPGSATDYFQINIGEGVREHNDGINKPAQGQFQNTNYTLKFALDETEEMVHWSETDFVGDGFTVSQIPVDVDYFLKHTEKGYDIEIRYGFDHMVGRDAAAKLNVIRQDNAMSFEYVAPAKTVVTEGKTFAFEVVICDTADDYIGFYALSKTENTVESRHNYDLFYWLEFSKAVESLYEDSLTTQAPSNNTEAPAPGTEAPTAPTGTNTPDPVEESGCASIAGGTLAALGCVLIAAFALCKKKDD